jgi:AraC-like DNA-binding protein
LGFSEKEKKSIFTPLTKARLMQKNIREITTDDILEMIELGEIRTNELLKNSQSLEMCNKLGRFLYKGEIYKGIIVTEQRVFPNEDIRMKINYSLNPVLNFHFVHQGTMQYDVSGKTIVQKDGTNTLWSVNEPHMGSILHEKDTKYLAMGVSLTDDYFELLVNKYPDLLTGFYRKYKRGCFMAQQSCTSCEMNIVVSQILKANMMGNAAEMYVDSKVLELLVLYLNNQKMPNLPMRVQCCKRRSDIEKIHEAHQILLSNLNTPPSIVELSRQVGINDFKLKYGFKEVFNQTVYGCLFEYKMKLALKLLRDTDKLIVEVASKCGYEYASHFSNAFKRKYGISPLEYRRRISN